MKAEVTPCNQKCLDPLIFMKDFIQKVFFAPHVRTTVQVILCKQKNTTHAFHIVQVRLSKLSNGIDLSYIQKPQIRYQNMGLVCIVLTIKCIRSIHHIIFYYTVQYLYCRVFVKLQCLIQYSSHIFRIHKVVIKPTTIINNICFRWYKMTMIAVVTLQLLVNYRVRQVNTKQNKKRRTIFMSMSLREQNFFIRQQNYALVVPQLSACWKN